MYCTCGRKWCEVWDWCTYVKVRGEDGHVKVEGGFGEDGFAWMRSSSWDNWVREWITRYPGATEASQAVRLICE